LLRRFSVSVISSYPTVLLTLGSAVGLLAGILASRLLERIVLGERNSEPFTQNGNDRREIWAKANDPISLTFALACCESLARHQCALVLCYGQARNGQVCIVGGADSIDAIG
jgi:hypothetical protein